MCFEDGYYDSPKALATTLNGDKPGRVRFYYEPVTQKVVAHMKGDTKVALLDILGFVRGDAVTVLTSSARSRIVRAYSIVDLRGGDSNRSTSIRASSNRASSAIKLHHCYE